MTEGRFDSVTWHDRSGFNVDPAQSVPILRQPLKYPIRQFCGSKSGLIHKFEKPLCQHRCKLLILLGGICRFEDSEYIC